MLVYGSERDDVSATRALFDVFGAKGDGGGFEGRSQLRRVHCHGATVTTAFTD